MYKFATVYQAALRKLASTHGTIKYIKPTPNQGGMFRPISGADIHSNTALQQAAANRPQLPNGITMQQRLAREAAQRQARLQRQKMSTIDRNLNTFFGDIDRQQAATNTAPGMAGGVNSVPQPVRR